MTRKEAFIAQRTKELQAAGKPVNVAQLEARFNELNATPEGKAQIAQKVGLFNAPAAPAPAPAPAPTPASPISAGFAAGATAARTAAADPAPAPTPAPAPVATPTPEPEQPVTPNVGSAASWALGGTFSSASDSLARLQEQMALQSAQREAEFQRQRDEQQRLMREQAERAYNEQRLLAAGEIEKINAARAGLERDFANRRAMTMGDIANVQSGTRASLAQVLRDYQSGRRAGLLGAAARGRGIDPSAAGRFLNQAAQQRGAALAQTQAGAFETISQLRKQLDAEQRRKEAGTAELARLSTTLGTNVSNYFPGIV